MAQIDEWLERIGLGRYAALFLDHDIDLQVLPELGEPDLEKLGISLGHRKKLLKAIAALAGEAQAGQGAAAASSPPAALRPEAERRQLTVLFSDLVGSTVLAAQLDPEDMRAVITAYQNVCIEIIRRYEGHVAKFMGDGVLAYFGYPQAHEDDAERAVRAGLDLAEAAGRVITDDGRALAVRVGIATGPVVVGDLIGEGGAQEAAVVGATPNLAARLQALATPASVVISQATRRLVGGLFELTDLGPVRLKGFAEPLSAWRVDGEGRAEGRFEALHGERLTPLVGREHELGILLERWAWARDRDGQVVLLSGEPGIGKSRLIRTLRERLGGEPYTPLSHYCSPYHTNSALHPVIGLLERAARLDRDEPPEAQLAKLEALLGQSSERLDEVVPLLAALLGVPTGTRYPALALTPEVQKRRTMQVLADQLAGLAARQPVLALYEDLHWIDPSTLELLGLVIERIQRLPVLVLMTFRPEFQPPWTGHAHVTTLTMSRLGRRQGADLVARVAGGKRLPAEVVEQIVARTDGVPLFVEELTKTVLESGLLDDAGDHYELNGPLPPLAIPATLHDSLMARLDRLAPVKEVAQTAAAIGREFSQKLLAAVAERPEDKLQLVLDRLVDAGLVFRRGTSIDAIYSFKHALVQDAAYQSLLKARRQQLHARIAQALEERFPEIVANEPELLARHWSEARATEQALRYWRQAGMRASERFAYVEAVHYLRTALRLLDDLPPSAARDRHELVLWLALGPALMSKGSWDAPEVGEACRRAHELARRVGEPSEVFAATWGLWMHSSQSANQGVARQLTSELISVAGRQNNSEMLLQAHHAAWTTAELLGDAASCLEHALRGIQLYRPDQHHSQALSYGGHDPGVCARFHEAFALWQLGYPDQALWSAHAAVELGRQLGHPSSLLMAMYYLAAIHWSRREIEAARRCADEVAAFCRRHDIPRYLGVAEIMRGCGTLMTEDRSAGLADIEQGLADVETGGPQLRRADSFIMLSEARRASSEFALARDALEQAKSFLSRFGLGRSAPEVVRLEGELLLASPASEASRAEGCFHKALAMARDQRAKSLELRAATSLARLWTEQGRRSEARDLLAPVYDWFTEGFDTLDLKDARALLDELS